MTRTTIDLPADLHAAVTSIAAHSRRSMNQTVAELLRRGLALPSEPEGVDFRIDELTGFPVISSPRIVTDEDVRAREDE